MQRKIACDYCIKEQIYLVIINTIHIACNYCIKEQIYLIINNITLL